MNSQTTALSGSISSPLFCPLGPMASAEAFGECLVRHGLVQSLALDDPDGYDGHLTVERIGAAYDEISIHLTDRAEEALQKVKDLMEDIQSGQNVKCDATAAFERRWREVAGMRSGWHP